MAGWTNWTGLDGWRAAMPMLAVTAAPVDKLSSPGDFVDMAVVVALAVVAAEVMVVAVWRWQGAVA